MRTEALRKRKKLLKGVALVAIVGGLALQADALQSMFRRAPVPPAARVALPAMPSLPAASAALPAEPGAIEGLPARDLSGVDVGRLDTGAGRGSSADMTTASPALAEVLEAPPAAADEKPDQTPGVTQAAAPAIPAVPPEAVAAEPLRPEVPITSLRQTVDRAAPAARTTDDVDCLAGCMKSGAPLAEPRAMAVTAPIVNEVACVAGCGKVAAMRKAN